MNKHREHDDDDHHHHDYLRQLKYFKHTHEHIIHAFAAALLFIFACYQNKKMSVCKKQSRWVRELQLQSKLT